MLETEASRTYTRSDWQQVYKVAYVCSSSHIILNSYQALKELVSSPKFTIVIVYNFTSVTALHLHNCPCRQKQISETTFYSLKVRSYVQVQNFSAEA